ncbi:MAG: HAD family hydrolase [Pleomorphochaeta sp.]
MKAALFDMDGVLVDTQKYHQSCYNDIAKDYYGIKLDKSINDKLKGVLRYEGAITFCKAVNIEPNEENIKYVSSLKNELYLKTIEKNKDSLLKPGAKQLLKRLKDKNVKLALASASSNAKYVIRLTGIDHYFDYVVDVKTIGKGKPNPAIFLDAASALCVKPSDCVVYEDAISGIEAANNCGMYSIAVNIDFSNTTFTYSNKIANRQVKTLEDSLCYRGLYRDLYDESDNCELFIFDAGNVVINNIHIFNDIFDHYNLDSIQRNEFINDYANYNAPLMDGNITTDFYINHINETMDLNIEGDPFYDYFKPEFNEVIVNLIKSLRKKGKRVVLGSNTYAPHTKKMKEMGLFDLFDEIYVSNEMHHYKPNPSFFRYILRCENMKAENTYFIDDMAENVASAAAIGINVLNYVGEDKNKILNNIFKEII